MSDWITFFKNNIDFIILGTLFFMSFIMLWKTIERFLFYRKVQVDTYNNIYDLDVALTKNLTYISSIGANAPYVGLLGTVIGILLTFYEIGAMADAINANIIMLNLSLALKSTAVGILVAIPSMMFYNGLGRKVEVLKSQWQSWNLKNN